MTAAAGLDLKLRLRMELEKGGEASPETIAEINALLAEISSDLKLR